MEQEYTAKNGIKIYTYKNEEQHGFFLSLYLRGGSMYEPRERSGITHFLEHVLVRNVNKQMGGRLYELLDEHGVEFNASTYAEMVQLYVSGASINFSVGTQVISALLRPIILTPAEINAERQRIKAEIRESDEKGSLQSFTAECVHGGTSLARPILGTNSTVDKITRQALSAYREELFCAENIFVYLTGAFSDDDLKSLIETVEKFTPYPAASDEAIHQNKAPVSNKFGKRDAAVFVKNSSYTAVRFTFDVDMREVDSPTLDLIYDMLLSGYSSPFFVKLSEERGLFYDISGGVERYKNIAELSFSYELREKSIPDALELSVKILNDFKSTVHDARKCMKAGYVDNAYLLLEDARELNFVLAYDNHIMDGSYTSVEERRALYDAITPERIREGACKIFTPDNLTLTIKGSKKKINTQPLREILKKLGE